MWKLIVCLALVATFVTAAPLAQKGRSKQSMPTANPALEAKIRRFAPTVLTANTARLSVGDRKALQKIIAAAKLIDPLYLRQVWSGNEALLQKLQADHTPLGRLRLHYFMINKGPWSQLDDDEPFIDGVPPKPPQADFYPDDITKDEFNTWVAGLSPEDVLRALSPEAIEKYLKRRKQEPRSRKRKKNG